MSKTAQEIFDISVTHVLRQGRPSIWRSRFNSAKCRYRTADGLACGAAPFIADYNPKLELLTFGSLVKKFPKHLNPDSLDHVTLIEQLQTAHDRAAMNNARSDANFISEYIRRVSLVASDNVIMFFNQTKEFT